MTRLTASVFAAQYNLGFALSSPWGQAKETRPPRLGLLCGDNGAAPWLSAGLGAALKAACSGPWRERSASRLREGDAIGPVGHVRGLRDEPVEAAHDLATGERQKTSSPPSLPRHESPLGKAVAMPYRAR